MAGTDDQTTAPAATFRARGHPEIRGTHTKTIEFTTDPHITARATCVVGVDADVDWSALQGVRGPIVVSLHAAGREDQVEAMANPRFAGDGRAILRRSDHRSQETLATGASKAARDLDRGLVQALTDPATELTVTVAAADAPPIAAAEVVVLGRATGVEGEEVERALAAAALLVDTGSGPHGREWGREDLPVARGEEARPRTWTCLEKGEVVVLAGDPGEEDWAAVLLREVADAGVPIRVVDEPDGRIVALLSTGLAGGGRRVFLGAPPGRRHERGAELAAAAGLGVVAVWDGPWERLAELLSEIAGYWGDVLVGVLVAPGHADEVHARGPARVLAEREWQGGLAGRGAYLVADLEGRTRGLVSGEVRSLLEALLGEGVPPRTLTDALQRLPQVSRRQAYDLVLGLRDAAEGPPARN